MDTHKNPYLDGRKPDLSGVRSALAYVHASTVDCVEELKRLTSDGDFDNSDKGQVLDYAERILRHQKHVHRKSVRVALCNGRVFQCFQVTTADDWASFTYEDYGVRKMTPKTLTEYRRFFVDGLNDSAMIEFTYNGSKYIVTDMLGEGKTSLVFSANQCAQGGEALVLKVARRGADFVIQQEVAILQAINQEASKHDRRVVPTAASLSNSVRVGGQACSALVCGPRCDPVDRSVRTFCLYQEDIIDICVALFYTHSAGYVHCDVAQRNVMLHFEASHGGRTGMLIDFGLAVKQQVARVYCGSRETASLRVIEILSIREEAPFAMEFTDDLQSLVRMVALYVLDPAAWIGMPSKNGRAGWVQAVKEFWEKADGDLGLHSLYGQAPTEVSLETYRAFGKTVASRFALVQRGDVRAEGGQQVSPQGSPQKAEDQTPASDATSVPSTPGGKHVVTKVPASPARTGNL